MRTLLPQRGLGGEVSRQWWSHSCHRQHAIGPLPAGPGPRQARSRVGKAPAGALCLSVSADNVNLC
jgi:hypothetical protein